MSAPEFVAIGHVTLDRFGEVTRPGGAALYAAVTADRLGLTAGVLTSHGDDFPLGVIPPRIEVVSVPSPRTTVFEHRQVPPGRALHVTAAAGPIDPKDVPEDWREAGIVLLAPVLNEVDPRVTTSFAEGACAAAIQGYLRRVTSEGAVVERLWVPPEPLLGRVQVMFLSQEDAPAGRERVIEWFQRVPCGVITAGSEGADLYVNGEGYGVRPRAAREVDPTGAGDVFAAAFMIEYHRHGDPWQAAAAAACAGGLSVEHEGWAAVPDRATLDAALAAYAHEA